jgi:preprotein translocase subunit SecE
VAKETRRQRRDARRAQGADEAERTPARRAPEPEDGGVAPELVPASVEPALRDGRRGGFIRESVAELRKVDWPNRSQVVQGTIVVLIACAVVGAFLYAADQVFQPFVRDILLGA